MLSSAGSSLHITPTTLALCPPLDVLCADGWARHRRQAGRHPGRRCERAQAVQAAGAASCWGMCTCRRGAAQAHGTCCTLHAARDRSTCSAQRSMGVGNPSTAPHTCLHSTPHHSTPVHVATPRSPLLIVPMPMPMPVPMPACAAWGGMGCAAHVEQREAHDACGRLADQHVAHAHNGEALLQARSCRSATRVLDEQLRSGQAVRAG